MTDPTKSEAQLVDELATRLNRVGLSRIDPARFLEERNEIVVELRRLARRLRGDSRRDSTTTWRAPGVAPREASARVFDGRAKVGRSDGR